MKRPRKSAASFSTILIISAIDVLICSFTAGLTLFFLATGSHHTEDETEIDSSARFAPTNDRFGIVTVRSSEAISVVALCEKDRRLTCPLKRLPANEQDKSNTITFFLNESPTVSQPLVLGSIDQNVLIDLNVDVSMNGRRNYYHVECVKGGSQIIRIMSDRNPLEVFDGCTLNDFRKDVLTVVSRDSVPLFLSVCNFGDGRVVWDCTKYLQSKSEYEWTAALKFIKPVIQLGMKGSGPNRYALTFKAGGDAKGQLLVCGRLAKDQNDETIIATFFNNGDVRAEPPCDLLTTQ